VPGRAVEAANFAGSGGVQFRQRAVFRRRAGLPEGVDSPGFTPIECRPLSWFGRSTRRVGGSAVSLVKIIIITVIVILSILFFGRFLF
jgi:hypothetical protein